MIDRLRDELRPVWLVAWRELRDQLRDWRILVPIFALTVFFPFLMNFTARAALNFATRYGTPLIGERFVPFLLMVVGFFPITVSLVIGLEAFVGEKERGTIEPLLSSPLKDWQLFLGKLTAAASAPLLTAYLGIGVYLAGLYFGGVPLPDSNRLAQTIVLTTVQGVLMVSGAILISTQATSVRAANLMSSFIIIPIALLIQGESILMFWGTNQVLWLAVAAVTVLAALLVRVGLAHFQREALLGREIDILNLRWMGRTFWRAFRGEAKSFFDWYRGEIPKTLRKQRISILITLLLGVVTVAAAYGWFASHSAQLAATSNPEDISRVLGTSIGLPGDVISFPFIFWHNVRAVAIIALLGLFSFGVLGVLFYVVNMATIGGVLGVFGAFGISPILLSVTGILPHGIFEIPALILSSAAILHLGVTLVTPAAHKTLGEALLEGLADWAKVNLGVVLPLLAIAAAVETWITPVLLLSILK
jgi:uncharacterized membrane protein SpoIIM required for sporulation/ABC-type transport system involved in multi-copper enzyme maturation permease subunit